MDQILIAYFSHAGQNYVNGNIVDLPVGNTKIIAEKFHRLTGAPLYHIEQEQVYPEDYHQLTEFAKKELRDNARPALKAKLPDLNKVNFIFLAYPNWWGTMPMPVWTFLESINSTNMKVAPLCTNEGSGMGRSEKDLRKLCPNAEILAGLPIIGHEVENSENVLKTWLKGLGINLK